MARDLNVSARPTPAASDSKRSALRTSRERTNGPTLTEAVDTWATPVASPSANRTAKPVPATADGRGHGQHLSAQAQAWAWPTPTAGDAASSGARNLEGSKAHAGVSLTDAALSGTSTVSHRGPAGSQSGMVLNPQFVEALMGFKTGWTDSAAWEMPLFRKLPR